MILGPYERNGQAWSIDGVPPEFGMELLPPELERIEDIAADCMARVPAAGQGGIKSIVNGPITFTPDANPLIGPAYGLPNAWILTGSSMGVMEGGGAGQFLAQWMDHGSPPADALAIDSRRFGAYADRDYRVSKAVECFAAQFGIHYPYEERSAGRQKRMSPIYQRLKDLGAVFGTAYGWERPNWFARNGELPETVLSFQRSNWFGAVAEECRCASEDVVLGDLSVFSKFRVDGPGADAFMATLGANTPPADGRVGLMHVLTEAGGVSSEFSVSKLAENHYYLVSAAAAERMDEDLLRHRARAFAGVEIKNLTEKRAVIGVMGPKSPTLMSAVGDADFSQQAFPWLSCREITVVGIPVLAIRVSYIGECGWELHVAGKDQVLLFEALWQAGQALGVGLYGAFAMNAMRLEKGYRGWGTEYTTERTPLESGAGAFVRTENRDFIGRQSLLDRDDDQAWNMALLELADTGEDPYYAHTVFAGDRAVGIVTSGGFGHRVGKPLALAYFTQNPDRYSLKTDLLSKQVKSTILNQIPYDPANLKLRSG